MPSWAAARSTSALLARLSAGLLILLGAGLEPPAALLLGAGLEPPAEKEEVRVASLASLVAVAVICATMLSASRSDTAL